MPQPAKHNAAPKRRSPKQTTDDERRALWVAVRDGNDKQVETLLATGMSPRFFDDAGETLLHMAARTDFAHIARLLIAAGADINAGHGGNNATPLHKAAWAGAGETADVLVSAGADLHARDDKGDTPLHKAMLTGRESIAYRLTRAGARLDAPNNNDWSPEDCATMTNHKNVLVQARLGQSLYHAARIKSAYRERRRKQSGHRPG